MEKYMGSEREEDGRENICRKWSEKYSISIYFLAERTRMQGLVKGIIRSCLNFFRKWKKSKFWKVRGWC